MVSDTPDYLPVVVGKSRTMPITVLAQTSTSVSIGALPAAFSIIENGCTGTVPVGEECYFRMRYTPTAPGTDDFPLAISYRDSEGNPQTFSYPIIARAIAPASLAFSTNKLDFGTVSTGVKAEKSVTLTNSGASPASDLAVASPAPDTRFAFQGGQFPGTGGTCGVRLLPGESCTLVLTAIAANESAVDSTLALGYSDGASNRQAALALGARFIRQITGIAAGYFHVCALASGGVQCWGQGVKGQLGNNTFTASNVPVKAVGLDSGVSALWGGSNTVFALKNGALYGWGANDTGELLIGTRNSGSPVPVAAQGLATQPTLVAPGFNSACGIFGGASKCWGLNNEGELGTGDQSFAAAPVQTMGLTAGVSAVSGSDDVACAIQNGAVKCWGENIDGVLGLNPATVPFNLSPVAVNGLGAGVSAIAVGETHACAIQNGGAVCWGNGANGQLGNNSRASSLTPVAVTGLGGGVTAIAVGQQHSCAVVNGAVKCWGDGASGQLGAGNTADSLVPVAVSGLGAGVTKISLGSFFSCAIADGGLKCWGQNSVGQLGNGTNTGSATPVAVTLAP
jgi:alpha-tubulin suppressor-like RCC1 family protein